MQADRAAGRIGKDPRTYLVNELIANLFKDAQRRAWAQVSKDAEVQDLIASSKLTKASEELQNRNAEASNRKFDEAQELLNIYK